MGPSFVHPWGEMRGEKRRDEGRRNLLRLLEGFLSFDCVVARAFLWISTSELTISTGFWGLPFVESFKFFFFFSLIFPSSDGRKYVVWSLTIYNFIFDSIFMMKKSGYWRIIRIQKYAFICCIYCQYFNIVIFFYNIMIVFLISHVTSLPSVSCSLYVLAISFLRIFF